MPIEATELEPNRDELPTDAVPASVLPRPSKRAQHDTRKGDVIVKPRIALFTHTMKHRVAQASLCFLGKYFLELGVPFDIGKLVHYKSLYFSSSVGKVRRQRTYAMVGIASVSKAARAFITSLLLKFIPA